MLCAMLCAQCCLWCDTCAMLCVMLHASHAVCETRHQSSLFFIATILILKVTVVIRDGQEPELGSFTEKGKGSDFGEVDRITSNRGN